jgi:hypothetical protein
VDRYRRQCSDWRQQFENCLGSYRFENRDISWYEEKLPIYRARLAITEKDLGPYDRHTAGVTLAFAQLLHEAGKPRAAARYYRIARERWRKTTTPMPESHRQEALFQISAGLDAIKRRDVLGHIIGTVGSALGQYGRLGFGLGPSSLPSEEGKASLQTRNL